MKIAFLFVHYFTPDYLSSAIGSIRKEPMNPSFETHIVVVDNGSLEADRVSIQQLADCYVVPKSNIGYAGGINLAMDHTDADILFILNPDVEVLPGCIDTLVQELMNGASVVGPSCYWDRDQLFSLPSTEQRSRRHELLRHLAVRSDSFATRARAAWRRHARAHWLAREPIESVSLSGALIGLHRATWDATGEMDVSYRLYFEETDWLIRARKQGHSIRYVPQARAIHHFNQSAKNEPDAAAWFVESESRFFRQHYGTWFARLLKSIRPMKSQQGLADSEDLADSTPPQLRLPVSRRSSTLSFELSHSPLGFPAACCLALPGNQATWQLPSEIWDKMASGRYYARFVDATGDELSETFIEKDPMIKDPSSTATKTASTVT